MTAGGSPGARAGREPRSSIYRGEGIGCTLWIDGAEVPVRSGPFEIPVFDVDGFEALIYTLRLYRGINALR